MGIFSNAFRPIQDLKSITLKNVVSCVPGNIILESINKYRDHLKTNSGLSDTFVSALTMSSDLMVDEVINSSLEITNTLSDFKQIPDELTDYLITGFSELCHHGNDEASKAGVTITDSCGRAYNIIDVRSEQLVIDGNVILFAMSNEVTDVCDAVLLRDSEGKIRLNNYVKTSDFVRINAAREEPSTLYDKMFSINIMAGKQTDSSSIVGLIERYTGSNVSNILDALNASMSTSYSNIEEALHHLWELENQRHPLTPGQGHVNSLWTVVSDIIESNALNSVISSACDAIIGGVNASVAILAVFQECINSKYKSIKNFGAGIANAFNKGGVYGVGCYILTYLQDLCNTRTEDGVLQFTDNSRLAPKIYIAGILQTVAVAITTVLSMIVMIFSRIAGAALAVLGTVASQIFGIIEYDYSSTNAAINTSDKVIIPISPYGVLQYEVTYSKGNIGEDLYSLFEQGENLMYAAIPGAYVLIGPGSYDNQGKVLTVRFELHPALHDSRAYFNSLVYTLQNNHYIKYKKADDNIRARLILDIPQIIRSDLALNIMRGYSNALLDYSLENQENEHLSDDDDAFVRELILKNLFIAGVYLSCAIDPNFMNDESCSYSRVGAVMEGGSTLYNYCSPNAAGSTPGFWYAFLDLVNKQAIMCADNNPFTGGLYTFDQSRGTVSYSWLQIYERAVQCITDNAERDYGLNTIFDDNDYYYNRQRYYDTVVTFNGTMEDAVFVPQYDRQSFWKNVIASAIITVMVATTVAVTVYATRKAIMKRRAYNQAQVQAAHEAFVSNPNDDTYSSYASAVRKNNVWASLIGGTKYDYVNYWNGDPASATTPGSTTGIITNILSDNNSLLGGSKVADTNSTINLSGAGNELANEKLLTVIRLLRG